MQTVQQMSAKRLGDPRSLDDIRRPQYHLFRGAAAQNRVAGRVLGTKEFWAGFRRAELGVYDGEQEAWDDFRRKNEGDFDRHSFSVGYLSFSPTA